MILGRQRAFFTDGKKVQKSKDDKYQEFDAHWEDYRLVVDEGRQSRPADYALVRAGVQGKTRRRDCASGSPRARMPPWISKFCV